MPALMLRDAPLTILRRLYVENALGQGEVEIGIFERFRWDQDGCTYGTREVPEGSYEERKKVMGHARVCIAATVVMYPLLDHRQALLPSALATLPLLYYERNQLSPTNHDKYRTREIRVSE